MIQKNNLEGRIALERFEIRPQPGSIEEAEQELMTIPGVALPPAVDYLRLIFEEAAVNPVAPAMILAGRKTRDIKASEPISRISGEIAVQQHTATHVLGDQTTFISTDLNQHELMREDFEDRTENPSQMVAAALQAFGVQEALQQRPHNPDPVFTAHTILPPTFENAFMKRYRGDKYLLSGHAVIIAPQEGHYDHYQLEQMSDLINPVI